MFVWPSAEWHLLIRHLLDSQRDSNCSMHFARLPIEIEYALSPIIDQDCHEPRNDFLPSKFVDCVSSFGRLNPSHRTSRVRSFSLSATKFEVRRPLIAALIQRFARTSNLMHKIIEPSILLMESRLLASHRPDSGG